MRNGLCSRWVLQSAQATSEVLVSEGLHPWIAGRGTLIWARGNSEVPEACGQVCLSSYNSRNIVQGGDLGSTVGFHSTWHTLN